MRVAGGGVPAPAIPRAARRLRVAGVMAWTLAILVVVSQPMRAQAREQQPYVASDPEGRLIAFYSAAMVFSSMGAWQQDRGWYFGVEGTWLPTLNEAQRRPGIDKPETTNLASVLPRPRLGVHTAMADLELSWVPPVTVGKAKANLLAVAVSRRVGHWRGVDLSPRLAAVTGRVEGAITCNAGTAAEGGQDLLLYYAAICHGNDSNDWFEPRLVTGELVAGRGIPGGSGTGRVWIAAGGRVDRSRFDIGVLRADGSRDPDHPVLRLRSTRPHVAVGVRWPIAPRVGGAAEWFYAPGSMATLRASVVVSGGRR